MNQGAFNLKNEQFWQDSTDFEEALVDRFEEDEALMGLFLDGPTTVGLDEQKTLPLLAVRACSLRDNAVLSLQRRAVLVTTRLESHETLAALAFRPATAPRSRRPPRDPDTLPEGRAVKVFPLSLTERVDGFPLKPGTWQTTLLLHDQRSNLVVTRLERVSSRDPAVREFLAAQRHPGYPAAISPPITPSMNPYLRRSDSPPPPEQPGIALAIEPVAVEGPGHSCWLRGSFCLPLRPRDVVRPLPGPPGSPAEKQALAAGWLDVGDAKATAVVPVTILLTGAEDAEPFLVPLNVPAYGALDRQVARGHFAVDLLAGAPHPLPIQSYAVWALSRTIISDPVVVSIVTEATSPTGGG
jgi:hypothetical protein